MGSGGARLNSGPARTPEAIRRLSGSHLDRINPNSPKYHKIENVPVPKIIAENAHAYFIWTEVGPELIALGILTRACLQLFTAFCVAYARWMEADEEVATDGKWLEEDVFDKKGEVSGSKRKRNPAIMEAIQHRREMLAIGAQFGLTPATQGKVSAPDQGENKKGFERFLPGADDGEDVTDVAN